MSWKHNINPFGQHIPPQSAPPEGNWSALVSVVIGPSTPSQAESTMADTTQAVVIASTVTVQSTILQTAYVTVHVTTNGLPPMSTPSSSSTSSSTSDTPSSTSTCTETAPPHSVAAIPSSSPHLSSSTTRSQHASLPPVITGASSTTSPSMTLSMYSHQPESTPSATALPQETSSRLSAHKQAVVGGLSGAVAGLVLIGVILCFCLRRRRKRREDEEDGVDDSSTNEKGLRPILARKWSEWTVGRGTPKPTPIIAQEKSPVIDDHIIRISLDHWSRPFAHEDGYRESMPPGALRVMNPDPSRPQTPRPKLSTDTAGSFLRKQRSALTHVLLVANRSRASSQASARPVVPLPTIHIDPALSRECVAPTAATPSFRSYPSMSSLPMVSQQPPEDPFLTPPQEESPPLETSPKRPNLAPLQSAAGAAGRSLSYLSSRLNPFRTKSSQAVDNGRTASHHSVSTLSSFWSRRDTARSDPFDLDRPSPRSSAGPSARTGNERQRSPLPIYDSLHTYDGT